MGEDESEREREMCARIAGYKRFSIVYKLSWVGGSVHRVFFCSGCFEVWLRIIFDLRSNF